MVPVDWNAVPLTYYNAACTL